MGHVKYGHELFEFLRQSSPSFFVVEDYLIRTKRVGTQHYTPDWDRAYAARAIGSIEDRADYLQVPVYFQQSSVLESTAGKFGIPYSKGKHVMDAVSAVLHGFYYAEKHLGLKPTGKELVPSPQPIRGTTVVTVSGMGDIAKALSKRQSRNRKRT